MAKSIVKSWWDRLITLADIIVIKSSLFVGWLSRLTRVSKQMLSNLGILAVFGLGANFLRLDEFAIADFFWLVLFLVFVLKIHAWVVPSDNPVRGNIAKSLLLFLSVVGCVFLLSLTNIRRGEEAWSTFYQKPEPFKTDQYRKTMLKKYPLGYVIFDIDYQDQVSPYVRQGLKLDWNAVRIKKIHRPKSRLSFQMPSTTREQRY